MMSESNSSRYFFGAALVVTVALIVFVVLNREPRFEGRSASDWFEEAQRDPDNLVHYGRVFQHWGDWGVRYLSQKMVGGMPAWKRHVVVIYNRYGSRIGLRPIPIGSNIQQRQTARRLLGYFEGDAISVLLEMVASASEKHRIAAIQAMSELGPANASTLGPHLVPLLRDPSPTIQYEAITTLAVLGYDPDQVIPLIVPFISHSVDRMRVEATYALGSYPARAEAALDALVTATEDRAAVVRANAYRALGNIGPPARVIVEPGILRIQMGVDLQIARVVEALPFIASPDELIGNPTFEGALDRILKTGDSYNAMMASRAQNRLGLPTEVMESSCNYLLKSKSNWQVWEAVDALSELQPMPPWARTLLERATEHPNGTVRSKARKALAP